MISKNTQFESIEYGHPELCRCKRCKWNGHKKEKYKDEIHLIATDPIEQLRVDTEYNKLKSQIQTRGTNGSKKKV